VRRALRAFYTHWGPVHTDTDSLSLAACYRTSEFRGSCSFAVLPLRIDQCPRAPCAPAPAPAPAVPVPVCLGPGPAAGGRWGWGLRGAWGLGQAADCGTGTCQVSGVWGRLRLWLVWLWLWHLPIAKCQCLLCLGALGGWWLAKATTGRSRSSKSNPITCSGAASARVLLVRAHLLVAYCN
jgi:hypothetical protein